MNHIEAMKQALDALVEKKDLYLAQLILEKAIEQAEKQEPVAWMSPNKERLEFSRKDTVYGSHTIPLYTAPPRKEWVGLTDDEEIELDEKYGDDFNAYIDARDAKLKEKNA